jgi:hypothetical protein
MNRVILISIIASLGLLNAYAQQTKTTPAMSPSTEGISKELGEEILNELRQIHRLLEKQQATAQGRQLRKPPGFLPLVSLSDVTTLPSRLWSSRTTSVRFAGSFIQLSMSA